MPETTVNEYRHSCIGEDQISSCAEALDWRGVDAVSKSVAVKNTSESRLGICVASFRRLHSGANAARRSFGAISVQGAHRFWKRAS
jgi:hypothetical protein